MNKNEIPESVVEDFLQDKLTIKEIANINMVKSHHLWNDRYRINVWVNKDSDDLINSAKFIGKSYFVQYEDKVITDRTLSQ